MAPAGVGAGGVGVGVGSADVVDAAVVTGSVLAAVGGPLTPGAVVTGPVLPGYGVTGAVVAGAVGLDGALWPDVPGPVGVGAGSVGFAGRVTGAVEPEPVTGGRPGSADAGEPVLLDRSGAVPDEGPGPFPGARDPGGVALTPVVPGFVPFPFARADDAAATTAAEDSTAAVLATEALVIRLW